MDLKKELIDRKQQLPSYGLGIFMIIAGLSKFLILDFWLGYEPQFILEILPLAAREITLIGGVFESMLGLMLFSSKRTLYAALLTSLWLMIITIQVARIGLWDIVIRDIGLVFYALSVTAINYRNN